jgi:hypothetical protein
MTTHVSVGTLAEDPRPVSGDPTPDIPNGPGRLSEDRESLAPWTVLTIFAVLLGILVSVSAIMGNNLVVLLISGGAAVIVLAIAGAVWLDHRLRPRRGVYTLPVRLGGTFLFAATALTAWLSLAFGQYLLYLAAVPLTGAIILEASARRFRKDQAAAVRASIDAARRQAR